MRNVLMISAAFPPTGGPGVQRSVKFCKYLPQVGWHPTVWAADPLDGFPQDDSLIDDVPDGVTVLRSSYGTGSARNMSLWGRVRNLLGESLMDPGNHPDELIGWARQSVHAVRRLVEERRIDAVYSTFSPGSNHWLGMQIQRATGLPWIADFRDLWTDDYRYAPRSAQQRTADRALEQEILEAADAVIGVSPRQTAILSSHVPHELRKFVTITNGYDPDDFQGMDRRRTDDGQWVVAHVGRLDRWRACDAWFDGLREFVQSNPEARTRSVVKVMGHVSREVRDRLNETGAVCCYEPYGSHREAIQEMHDADALLLLVPDGPNADSVIPAKLFEYLASRRPILVIGPLGGECQHIVNDVQAGRAVNFNGREVARALGEMFKEWKGGQGAVRRSSAALDAFSRRAHARQLADVLDRVASPRTAQIGPDNIEIAGSVDGRLELMEAT